MEYSSIETHTRCFLFQIDKEIDNEIYQDLMDFETSGETIVMDFCNPYDSRNLKPAKNWTQNKISLWEDFCNKHQTDDALIVQNVRKLEKTRNCTMVDCIQKLGLIQRYQQKIRNRRIT